MKNQNVLSGVSSRQESYSPSGSNSRRHDKFSSATDKARHDKMVSLVEQMLDLHKRKTAADAASQERLQRIIDSTDKQIDALMHDLYELTKEEIVVVEGGR